MRKTGARGHTHVQLMVYMGIPKCTSYHKAIMMIA